MGRIITQVKITNSLDPSKSLETAALVDTGASHLTLPRAWRDKLGEMETIAEGLEFETATQAVCVGDICGPVKIQVGNFRAVVGEVLFIDLEKGGEEYEPLLGYLVLEAIPVAVDMLGHRLVKVRALDLK
jgi:predicted aspartyl protease